MDDITLTHSTDSYRDIVGARFASDRLITSTSCGLWSGEKSTVPCSPADTGLVVRAHG